MHVETHACSSSDTNQSENDVLVAQVVTGVIFYPIVCIVGLITNGLTLAVFLRNDMLGGSTNTYLRALAVANIVKLANEFVYPPSVLSTLLLGKSDYAFPLYYPFGHFLTQSTASITAWLTVAVAVERFLLVKCPISAREYMTLKKARLECCIIFIGSFLFNLPGAFRYVPVRKAENQLATENVTELSAVVNSTANELCEQVPKIWTLEQGELWRSDKFSKPYNICQTLFRSIVPVSLLVMLNITIIVSLRKRFQPRRKQYIFQRLSEMNRRYEAELAEHQLEPLHDQPVERKDKQFIERPVSCQNNGHLACNKSKEDGFRFGLDKRKHSENKSAFEFSAKHESAYKIEQQKGINERTETESECLAHANNDRKLSNSCQFCCCCCVQESWTSLACLSSCVLCIFRGISARPNKNVCLCCPSCCHSTSRKIYSLPAAPNSKQSKICFIASIKKCFRRKITSQLCYSPKSQSVNADNARNKKNLEFSKNPLPAFGQFDELFGKRPSFRRLPPHHRVTIMLAGAAVSFAVFASPDAVLSLFGFGYYDTCKTFRIIREVTDLLLVMNADTNFFLYYYLNKKFRSCLRNSLYNCCGYNAHQRRIGLDYTDAKPNNDIPISFHSKRVTRSLFSLEKHRPHPDGKRLCSNKMIPDKSFESKGLKLGKEYYLLDTLNKAQNVQLHCKSSTFNQTTEIVENVDFQNEKAHQITRIQKEIRKICNSPKLSRDKYLRNSLNKHDSSVSPTEKAHSYALLETQYEFSSDPQYHSQPANMPFEVYSQKRRKKVFDGKVCQHIPIEKYSAHPQCKTSEEIFVNKVKQKSAPDDLHVTLVTWSCQCNKTTTFKSDRPDKKSNSFCSVTDSCDTFTSTETKNRNDKICERLTQRRRNRRMHKNGIRAQLRQISYSAPKSMTYT